MVDTQTTAPSTGLLTIDLDALARNYRLLCAAAGAAVGGAVVKADAYGLGVDPVARCLHGEGCRHFFVATLGEALELRAILREAVIYVLEGALPGAEHALAEAGLVPVLNSLEQVTRYAGQAETARRPAALHIDTGMTRLGLSAREVGALADNEGLLSGLRLQHVMTHLACADQPSHPVNAEQLERFDALRSRLPAAQTCIGSSAGVLMGERFRGDLVRLGIGLYGGNPFSDGTDSPVEAVVHLQGAIVQVHEVTEPRTVGYGATHRVEPPARLATVGLGYADGYPRALGNHGFALLAGVRVPVIGRVSMDLLTLDVSAVAAEAVYPGAWVDLIGAGVSLDEVAAAAGTISYELLTRLGPRLRRCYRRGAD